MPVGGYLDKVLCFELIFHQTMFTSAWVHFVHWQLGFFLRYKGFTLLGFLLNSNYGRMAGFGRKKSSAYSQEEDTVPV